MKKKIFESWRANEEGVQTSRCCTQLLASGHDYISYWFENLELITLNVGSKFCVSLFLLLKITRLGDVFAGALHKARIARAERNECCKSLINRDECQKCKFLFWNFRKGSIQWLERWAIILQAKFFGVTFLFVHLWCTSHESHPGNLI